MKLIMVSTMRNLPQNAKFDCEDRRENSFWIQQIVKLFGQKEALKRSIFTGSFRL